MANAKKILEKMKANPKDWRIDKLKTVATAHNVTWRQKGSHVIFADEYGETLPVPAKRPIKPVYIKMFVAFIEG